jgi:hypothetical protein
MAPPNLQAGGHRFDFVSGLCMRWKMPRKTFEANGHPPQAVPPDPASLAPTNTKPSDIPPGATAIQVGGKQYTRVAGLSWIESTKPDSFADVSVGPNDLQSKDQPTPLPPKTAEAAKAPKRVVQGSHYYDRAPQLLQAFIDTVMLPFDFLSYPGRRDW